jgi:hypothetical protein
MILQWKRRLLLGLGLSVALVLAVALPATASAVSTLTGENLNGVSFSGNSFACPSPTYNVSGTATGPYPGTFTETGTWNQGTGAFSATFTITSGTTTITGSKSGSLSVSPPSSFLECDPEGLIGAGAHLSAVAYTATIHTQNGNFHDEGTSAVDAAILGSLSFNAGKALLTESFTSSLARPVPVAPTSKDQCKNNGWKNFPQFKNQGECVSFVQSHNQT